MNLVCFVKKIHPALKRTTSSRTWILAHWTNLRNRFITMALDALGHFPARRCQPGKRSPPKRTQLCQRSIYTERDPHTETHHSIHWFKSGWRETQQQKTHTRQTNGQPTLDTSSFCFFCCNRGQGKVCNEQEKSQPKTRRRQKNGKIYKHVKRGKKKLESTL